MPDWQLYISSNSKALESGLWYWLRFRLWSWCKEVTLGRLEDLALHSRFLYVGSSEHLGNRQRNEHQWYWVVLFGASCEEKQKEGRAHLWGSVVIVLAYPPQTATSIKFSQHFSKCYSPQAPSSFRQLFQIGQVPYDSSGYVF